MLISLPHGNQNLFCGSSQLEGTRIEAALITITKIEPDSLVSVLNKHKGILTPHAVPDICVRNWSQRLYTAREKSPLAQSFLLKPFQGDCSLLIFYSLFCPFALCVLKQVTSLFLWKLRNVTQFSPPPPTHLSLCAIFLIPYKQVPEGNPLCSVSTSLLIEADLLHGRRQVTLVPSEMPTGRMAKQRVPKQHPNWSAFFGCASCFC